MPVKKIEPEIEAKLIEAQSNRDYDKEDIKLAKISLLSTLLVSVTPESTGIGGEPLLNPTFDDIETGIIKKKIFEIINTL